MHMHLWFLKKLSLIAVLLVGAAAVFVLWSLVPIEGNYTFRIVQSGSMEPAIKTGSVIATIPRAEYRVGDVVTFEGTQVNPMPTTHRIVGIEKGDGGPFFATQGDANEDQDYRRVTQAEILGKVFLSVPYAGYAADFFGTANGKATLATMVGVALVLMFAPWKSILTEEKKKKNTMSDFVSRTSEEKNDAI